MNDIERHIKLAEELKLFPDDMIRYKSFPNTLVEVSTGIVEFDTTSEYPSTLRVKRQYFIRARIPANNIASSVIGEQITITADFHECHLSKRLKLNLTGE